MIRRIRESRTLLAACGLPLAGVHVGLLFLSVFLHEPREEGGDAIAGLPAAFHHHDFQITGGSAVLRTVAAHCPGCLLERSPAWISDLAEVVPVSGPSPADGRQPYIAPAFGAFRTSAPRAPPLA